MIYGHNTLYADDNILFTRLLMKHNFRQVYMLQYTRYAIEFNGANNLALHKIFYNIFFFEDFILQKLPHQSY